MELSEFYRRGCLAQEPFDLPNRIEWAARRSGRTQQTSFCETVNCDRRDPESRCGLGPSQRLDDRFLFPCHGLYAWHDQAGEDAESNQRVRFRRRIGLLLMRLPLTPRRML